MTTVDPFVWQLPSCYGKDPQEWTITDSREMLEHHRRLMFVLNQLRTQSAAVEDVVAGDEPTLPGDREPAWDPADEWREWALP